MEGTKATVATIDIVMPVRNGAAYIGDAIRSLIDQTERDWRLRVFNHGSTDDTGAIVAALAATDPRIEQVPCAPSLTLSEVRNLGFERAEAPFIALHDADDLSLPERLSRQRRFLEDHPDLALVGGQYETVDATATRSLGVRRLPHAADRLRIACLFNNPIAQPTVMLRRSVIERHGARYGDGFLEAPGVPSLHVPTLAEDYWLFAQLALLGLCANLPDTLIRYRQHGGNISISKFDAQMAVSEDISDQLMRLLTARHGEAWQSVLPFCNHGARLAPVADRRALPAAWRRLRATLLRIFGDTPGVQRELAFRDVLSNRTLPLMLGRFACLRLRGGLDSDEMATIRHILSAYKPAGLRRAA